MKSFGRKDLLAKQIMRELGDIVLKKKSVTDNIVISITDAEITRDLRYCKVYYSVLGDEEAKKSAADYFQRHLKELREELAHRIRVKHVPELQFLYDVSIVRGQRIEELLNQIKRENEQKGN